MVVVVSATIMSLFVVGRLVAVGAFLVTALWGLLAIALQTTNDNVRIAVVLASTPSPWPTMPTNSPVSYQRDAQLGPRLGPTHCMV